MTDLHSIQYGAASRVYVVATVRLSAAVRCFTESEYHIIERVTRIYVPAATLLATLLAAGGGLFGAERGGAVGLVFIIANIFSSQVD